MEFFNGETKLGESVSSPWTFAWDNVPDGNYSLTAIATDNLLTKSVSEPVHISIIQNITDISQNQGNYNSYITLFPNPSHGVITMVLSQTRPNKKSEINIISLEGKVIYNGILFPGEFQKQYDLTSLKPGVYIFELIGEDGIFRSSFIKD